MWSARVIATTQVILSFIYGSFGVALTILLDAPSISVEGSHLLNLVWWLIGSSGASGIVIALGTRQALIPLQRGNPKEVGKRLVGRVRKNGTIAFANTVLWSIVGVVHGSYVLLAVGGWVSVIMILAMFPSGPLLRSWLGEELATSMREPV